MDITEMDLSEFLESEEQLERSQKLIEASQEFMQSCGKEKIEVYRIENFTPTLQPKESYGKFFEGDSYVICKKETKEYNIHYWHGNAATTDEIGTSAAFTTQLSGALSLQSNHHLEEQDQESELFASYFKNGIEYMPGGVDSGFNMVDEKPFEPRLLQVKGERYPRIFRVPLEANSINVGDVFILDMGETIYFYAGDECNVKEKMKALKYANDLRKSERHCQAEIVYPQDEEDVAADFWESLGGKPDEINPATSDNREDFSQDEALKWSLYKISNEDGKLACTAIEERPLTKDMLDTKCTFVLETHMRIVCWIGKEADVEEKKNALLIGKGFLKAHKKPKGTVVMRTCEGTEFAFFKSFFEGFYPIVRHTKGEELDDDAKQNMEALANKKKEQVEALMTMLGDYTTKVYLCKDGENVEIPEAEHGFFFQEEVYLIDVQGENHRYLIQWFGPRLPGDQVSGLRSHMDELTGGVFEPSKISRVSVFQGHEDDSLLKFFPNGFICLDGAREEIADRLASIKSDGAMFRVQGPNDETPQAIRQDETVCSNLNSNESFVVVPAGGEIVYAWSGVGASSLETEYSVKFANVLVPGASVSEIKEEEEPEEFFEALGGKTEYFSTKDLNMAPNFEPRLFQCTNAGGFFHMKELDNFTQHDLNNHDIMVVDVYSTIYMWLGVKANKAERENCIKKVEEYVEATTDGRNKAKVQYVPVDPCQEPLAFKGIFPEWEADVAAEWLQPDPYEAAMLAAKAEREKYMEEKYGNKEVFDNAAKFSLDELKEGTPDGVDPAAKEQHLSEDDFKEAFGMTVEEFGKIAKWKQKKLKQDLGLY